MKKVKKKRREQRRRDPLFKVTSLLRGKLDLKKIITQIHCFESNISLLASSSPDCLDRLLDPEKVNIMEEWTKGKTKFALMPPVKVKKPPPLNTNKILIVEEEHQIRTPNVITTNRAFDNKDHHHIKIHVNDT